MEVIGKVRPRASLQPVAATARDQHLAAHPVTDELRREERVPRRALADTARELSVEPDDMRELVERVGRVRASRGRWGKSRQPSELPLLDAVRKGVVAARGLPVGQRLEREDLMFARPATGIPSQDLPQVLGKRLTRPLKAGELLTPDVLEG